MGRHAKLITALAAAPLALAATLVRAQPAATGAGPAPGVAAAPLSGEDGVNQLVVTADRVGLLEKRPDAVVFGLDKALIDTPRSATFVSDETIQRYGITTVDNLVEIAPGTFTASYYGVPGSLNIRGTYAENYIDGFKLIDNLGTYTTPIGDAAQIDIVRGPPSPVYGPGKVGGFLNFIPKSAKDTGAFLDQPTGEVDVTLGDYQKKNLTAQGGAPVALGEVRGGVYLYGEIDDSHSYYKGIYPKHQLLEASFKFDLPENWSFDADVLVYHSSGDVQTPGWNRLTQSLIDNGTYITGRNTALSASPGASYLTPAQTVVGGQGYYPYGVGFDQAYFGAPVSDPRFVLNTGVGTTQLSPRTVYISNQDFSKTFTPTLYMGLSKKLQDGAALKFQLFYTALENQRYVSYGFPAWFRAQAVEGRVSYENALKVLDGFVTAKTVAGVSTRFTYSRDQQSYDSGLIALDRRDISFGATPSDSICDPFSIGDSGDSAPANCQGWETDIHSQVLDGGAFITSDIEVGKRLDVILGARYDEYDVRSSDTGVLAAYDAVGEHATSKGDGTYSASVSYKLPFGLRPYGTIAKSSALEIGQASDIAPDLIENHGWLRDSDLIEGGVKFQFFGGALSGALDYYRQDRPQLQGQAPAIAVVNTVAKGVELEARYLVTRNISFTFAGDIQHTEVIGPDTSFQYIPAYAVCGQNPACLENTFGGQYVVYQFDTLPGRGGNYAFSPIPHSVDSLYANYVSDRHAWGRAGATFGVSRVSKTSGTIQDAVVYPAYYLCNLSAFYKTGPWELDGNIDNLFNARYFTPDADTYVNMAALPGVGQTWRVTLKRIF